LPPWNERAQRLIELSLRQLFFIGGAPRSGTTWLQYLLDAHPEIRCGGEGLLQKHLAEPVEKLMAGRRAALQAKNSTIFRHSGGFPLPRDEDAEALLGAAILLELERLRAGKDCRAIGEKTPENVFFFPRLKRMFPSAKFLGMARDPRDVLCSAWHFFQRREAAGDAAKADFVRQALPALQQGARAMLGLRERYPEDCMIVTYERLLAVTAPVAAELFRFLGVADGDAIVADCVARTSFAALTGGRDAGAAEDGSFFRKGVAGDWRSTFSEATGEMIVRELRWCFAEFGWRV
jgi:hypothetical protein